MGRRSVPLSDQDRWVFNRVADAYRARPPYPAALVDRLAALAGGAGARVADLGAGTGLAALPLAARGLHVDAVEPAAAMLCVAAERLAAEEPGAAGRLRLVHATAERSGLPGGAFDLVLLADVVQWVDPELAGGEAARLLRPGGAFAVVEGSFAATAFMDALRTLLAGANPKAKPRPPGRASQLLSIATGGAEVHAERFEQRAQLDDAAIGALVRSLSYAGPALAPAQLDVLVAGALGAARACGGASFVRDLALTWARARS